MLLAREGPDLVEKLLVEELQVPFDREGADFHWTLEGAHSIPRVLHVKDETGAADRARAHRGLPAREEHPLAPRRRPPSTS